MSAVKKGEGVSLDKADHSSLMLQPLPLVLKAVPTWERERGRKKGREVRKRETERQTHRERSTPSTFRGWSS